MSVRLNVILCTNTQTVQSPVDRAWDGNLVPGPSGCFSKWRAILKNTQKALETRLRGKAAAQAICSIRWTISRGRFWTGVVLCSEFQTPLSRLQCPWRIPPVIKIYWNFYLNGPRTIMFTTGQLACVQAVSPVSTYTCHETFPEYWTAVVVRPKRFFLRFYMCSFCVCCSFEFLLWWVRVRKSRNLDQSDPRSDVKSVVVGENIEWWNNYFKLQKDEKMI